jgi:general stress protein 26
MSDIRPATEYAASKLVAVVERIIGAVDYCWLLSRTEGAIRARPMGRILARPGEDELTIRFLTDGRSKKAADIRRSQDVRLIFQKEAEDAYVSLEGTARLNETNEYVQALWKEAYGRYFPTTDDRAHAAFIEVEVTRMELWVRGLTPEPFGVRPTIMTRELDGTWMCTI